MLNVQQRIVHRVAYHHELRICRLQKVAALTGCVARQGNTSNSWQEFLVRSKWFDLFCQNFEDVMRTVNREINQLGWHIP